ncbi:MAG TPA: zf-HC2 domain-containing protein [Dokdonella sp.]
MDCSSARNLLPLYFDGELDRAASREFEAHLDTCADCRAALIELDALRRTLRSELPRSAAPQALRDRIQAQVRAPGAVRARASRTRWLALAASWALAFVAGGLLLPPWQSQRGPGGEQIERDLFASHWRALAAASPVDVVSTDRHTVKPWFAGKVAQAPVVQDFAEQGFALVGGRLDYVGSERVPVLVYRHGQHLIDVFVLGTPEQTAAAVQRQGYSLDFVTLGGQVTAIVTDMDATELEHFARLLSAAK